MNISIVGTGYVGLVVGTCLSDFGMNVICVDNDQSKIDMLNKGEVPIYEIGLGEKIKRNVKLNRLHFSSDLKSAIRQSLVIFIGVGTPENENGSVNLDYINEVALEIARSINDYKVIVIKSTVTFCPFHNNLSPIHKIDFNALLICDIYHICYIRRNRGI